MALSEWLSIAINLAVASYLIYFYPKSQQKVFRGIPVPPGFVILRKVMQAIGYAVVLVSVGYAVYRLMGYPQG
jgi:hypothetical protein